jgi:hypothetical protein
MKAFLVGLLFLAAVMVFAGLGVLLYPFLALLTVSLQFVLGILIIIFVIWLLGKLIIFAWDKLNTKKKNP